MDSTQVRVEPQDQRLPEAPSCQVHCTNPEGYEAAFIMNHPSNLMCITKSHLPHHPNQKRLVFHMQDMATLNTYYHVC